MIGFIGFVRIFLGKFALEKIGLVKMENVRLLIFMEKPERSDLHFAAVVRRCSVQSANQWPDGVNCAA
jgi:hypothetical protein